MTQSVDTAYKTEYDKLFIGGKWVEPSTSEVIEVFSPATGEKVGQVPQAAEADVNAACAAARKAFDEGPWPHTPPAERAAVIGRALKLLEDRADLFKHLLKLETGQPPTIVDIMQYGASVSTLQFYAGVSSTSLSTTFVALQGAYVTGYSTTPSALVLDVVRPKLSTTLAAGQFQFQAASSSQAPDSITVLTYGPSRAPTAHSTGQNTAGTGSFVSGSAIVVSPGT